MCGLWVTSSSDYRIFLNIHFVLRIVRKSRAFVIPFFFNGTSPRLMEILFRLD